MSETTKIAQWPESMMSIGPTDHLSRGITSERAIKMVQERERTKKEAYTLEYYAILFARLFSPDTIAKLLRGCHRYSILVHDDSSNAAQQTSRFELLNMGEQIPELVKELVNAYIAADTAVETNLGISVGMLSTFTGRPSLRGNYRVPAIRSPISEANSGVSSDNGLLDRLDVLHLHR